jgi:hypothetical protein
MLRVQLFDAGLRHNMGFNGRTLKVLVVGTAIIAGAITTAPRAAQADTTSTVLIAAGAAAIVGALLTDSNNHPYYVKDNRRYYVTQDEANYYGAHHNVVRRQAWVPESEYPVGRNAGYRVSGQRTQQPQHPARQHGSGHGNNR